MLIDEDNYHSSNFFKLFRIKKSTFSLEKPNLSAIMSLAIEASHGINIFLLYFPNGPSVSVNILSVGIKDKISCPFFEQSIVSIRPTPIAFSKHEAGAHQYPYLYG